MTHDKNVSKKSNPLIKVSGLWKNTSKNGEKYLTGKLSNNGKWIAMKNGFKNKESDPDFILYITATDDQKVSQPETHKNTTNVTDDEMMIEDFEF